MIAVLVILLLATIGISFFFRNKFWKIHSKEMKKLQDHLIEKDEAHANEIAKLHEDFNKQKNELQKQLSIWTKLPGIRKEKLFKDLPFEEGKTYTTKYQTRTKYTVLKIRVDKNGKQLIDREGRQTIDLGYGEEYKDRPDFRYGISAERLHADKEEIGERWICGHCSHPLEEKSKHKFFNI